MCNFAACDVTSAYSTRYLTNRLHPFITAYNSVISEVMKYSVNGTSLVVTDLLFKWPKGLNFGLLVWMVGEGLILAY